MSDRVLVSVVCVTYNHEPYIRQCLESLVSQKCNFAYEVLVHDDASSDKTVEIIKEYESKYPSVIKPIYQDVNQYSKGISPTIVYNIPRAKGKYIAVCEGDDYWCDCHKLENQVRFLEGHPDYGMCYTKCMRYYEKDNFFEKKPWGGPNESFYDLLESNTIPTLTVMYRTDLVLRYIKEIEPQKYSWRIGDYPMWLYFSYNTKIKFLDRTTGIYRVLENSASHFISKHSYIKMIDSSIDISRFFLDYYKCSIDVEQFVNKRRSRLASSLVYIYDDAKEAIKILQSINRKSCIDYLKILIFKSKILTSILRAFKIG